MHICEISIRQTVTVTVPVSDYCVLYNEHVACEEEEMYVFIIVYCLVFMNSRLCHLSINGDIMKI